jgi:DNA-binding MarR family transcriptional regulator
MQQRSPTHDRDREMMAEAERTFGWLVTDVARMMRTVFDRRVKTLGITRPQWLALTRLKRKPGASQSELADMMEIERAPAGKIIDRLEERGWVERRPDPEDRRINRIFLTDLGERVHAAIWPIGQAMVAEALADLSAGEAQRLTDLLCRVKARLSEMALADSCGDIDLPDEIVGGEADEGRAMQHEGFRRSRHEAAQLNEPDRSET